MLHAELLTAAQALESIADTLSVPWSINPDCGLRCVWNDLLVRGEVAPFTLFVEGSELQCSKMVI